MSRQTTGVLSGEERSEMGEGTLKPRRRGC